MIQMLVKFAVDQCADATQGQVALPADQLGQCNNFSTGLPSVAANSQTITPILQLVFGVIGAVVVVYMMYSAITFMRSQGDPQTVAKARNGIIYALIGLVIVISAEAIVTFVLGKL